MQKIGQSTNTADANGEFTEGNAAGGVAATLLRADWLNSIQRELVALATLGGGELDPSKSTQAKEAISALLAKLAPLISPAFSGTPTAPTAAAGSNTTQLATTAFVTAVQTLLNTAIGQRAPLASPGLTGTPTAPTAAQTVNNTQIATTAFVKAAVAALVDSSPGALDTLKELADALDNDPNFATSMVTALGLKAPLASPGFTGTPTAPTAAAGTNTTQLATTAFVTAVQTLLTTAIGLRAPLASPGFTGTPTAPTAAQTVNNTQIATTAFVKAAVAALVDSSPGALDTLKELADALGNDPNFATSIATALGLRAPLASPAFTGAPTAPTPAAATNNTQLANTAWVRARLAELGVNTAALTDPGFWRCGVTGLMIQWGNVYITSSPTAYLFKTAFPSTCLVCLTGPGENSTGGGAEIMNVEPGTRTRTGFSASATFVATYPYIAIGF